MRAGRCLTATSCIRVNYALVRFMFFSISGCDHLRGNRSHKNSMVKVAENTWDVNGSNVMIVHDCIERESCTDISILPSRANNGELADVEFLRQRSAMIALYGTTALC